MVAAQVKDGAGAGAAESERLPVGQSPEDAAGGKGGAHSESHGFRQGGAERFRDCDTGKTSREENRSFTGSQGYGCAERNSIGDAANAATR